jgi:serine/threonine protein kinase
MQRNNSHSALHITYFARSLTRTKSFIQLLDEAGHETILTPEKEIGHGEHGSVTLFASQDQSTTLAVKRMLTRPRTTKQPKTEDEIQEYTRIVNNEFNILTRVNPDPKSYSLTHLRDENNRYDYRMVMPYIKGVTINDFIKNEIQTAAQFALLFLKLSDEVMRIHRAGFFHGDVTASNIICKHYRCIEFGLMSFKTRLVDFNLANEIGKSTLALVADSIQPIKIDAINDITNFQYLLDYNLEAFCLGNPDEALLLQENFPELLAFAKGAEHSRPPEADELINFNRGISDQLSTWQQRHCHSLQASEDQGLSTSYTSMWIKQAAIAAGALLSVTAALVATHKYMKKR